MQIVLFIVDGLRIGPGVSQWSCSVVKQYGSGYFRDGSRVNRLWLGWMFSYTAFRCLCRYQWWSIERYHAFGLPVLGHAQTICFTQTFPLFPSWKLFLQNRFPSMSSFGIKYLLAINMAGNISTSCEKHLVFSRQTWQENVPKSCYVLKLFEYYVLVICRNEK